MIDQALIAAIRQVALGLDRPCHRFGFRAEGAESRRVAEAADVVRERLGVCALNRFRNYNLSAIVQSFGARSA